MSVNDIRNAITTELFEVREGENNTNATFILGNEDHTLGNALRHVLINKSKTEFCGYSIPHPYEPKLHLRLQSNDNNITSLDLFKEGLKDLEQTSIILENEFVRALKEFENSSHKKKTK